MFLEKIIFLFIILAFPFFSNAGNLGAGVVLGDPTAITAKYWNSSNTAYDFGLSFFSGSYVSFYSDYLWHYPGYWKSATNHFVASLTPYVGIGGIVVIAQSSRANNDHLLGTSSGSLGIGVRVPFGCEWRPTQPPIGVFAEIAPGMSIIPNTAILVQIGLGVRYYFN